MVIHMWTHGNFRDLSISKAQKSYLPGFSSGFPPFLSENFAILRILNTPLPYIPPKIHPKISKQIDRIAQKSMTRSIRNSRILISKHWSCFFLIFPPKSPKSFRYLKWRNPEPYKAISGVVFWIFPRNVRQKSPSTHPGQADAEAARRLSAVTPRSESGWLGGSGVVWWWRL